MVIDYPPPPLSYKGEKKNVIALHKLLTDLFNYLKTR